MTNDKIIKELALKIMARGMKNETIEQTIENVKSLLKEAEQFSSCAAAGYDEGWANGACTAYGIALGMLEDLLQIKGDE